MSANDNEQEIIWPPRDVVQKNVIFLNIGNEPEPETPRPGSGGQRSEAQRE